MGIKFDFPNPLETGDCIAVVGEVGRKQFILKLSSNFEAFNPDLIESAACNDDGDNILPSKAPVSATTPLMVSLNTNGEWDIVGETPETSTNASGYNAARNGFRPREMFACKIYIKREHFAIYLNRCCLSLSDHMIPVSCIQSVIIEGDCFIGRLFYGDAAAVDQSVRKAKMSNRPKDMQPNQFNLEASVVEVRVKDEEVESLKEYEIFPETSSDDNGSYVKSSTPIRTSFLDLPSLFRSTSYQIVFGAGDSDDGDDDYDEIDAYKPDNEFPLSRAVSCDFLASIVPRPGNEKFPPPPSFSKIPVKSSLLPSRVYKKASPSSRLSNSTFRKKMLSSIGDAERANADIKLPLIARPQILVNTQYVSEPKVCKAGKTVEPSSAPSYAVKVAAPPVIHSGYPPKHPNSQDANNLPKPTVLKPRLSQPEIRLSDRPVSAQNRMQAATKSASPPLLNGKMIMNELKVPFKPPAAATTQ